MKHEKTVPMAMHKNMVLNALANHPEDVQELVPGFDDAEKAKVALVDHPGEWIVNGELLTPEEWEKHRRYYGLDG